MAYYIVLMYANEILSMYRQTDSLQAKQYNTILSFLLNNSQIIMHFAVYQFANKLAIIVAEYEKNSL